MKQVLWGAALAAVLAAGAAAQSEVWLANGVTIQGNVIEDDGEKIKVALVTDGGSGATATYRYEQLAPATIYRLRFNKSERTDVKGQIELAEYALDNGVFPSARLSYDLAKKANEAQKAGYDEKLAKLYARAPGAVIAWAKKKIEENHPMEAHRALARVCELFSDSDEGAEAARLIEEIAPKCTSFRENAVGAKAPADNTAQEAAAPAIKRYHKAHETVRKAAAEYKSTVQTTRTLKLAIEEFQSARKLLDDAMKKEGEGSDLAKHYAAWTAKVDEDIADTYVSMANTYFSRQSLKDAMDAVNEALKIDPNNSEAKATQARIQIAGSDSSRWKW